jgi:predicted dehydrogenase
MRTVILGVGRMGRRHIHAVQKLGLELAGVYDVSAESLALAKKESQLAEGQLFGDLDCVFDVCKPECLIIATTADSHCELACLGASRGVKFILVEKPIAVSLEQCQRMIDVCDQYGAKLAVNHQVRFLEQYTKPKELLASQAYGGFKSMAVVAGNFGISMNGTHYFEAFRFMADEEPSEVRAWFSPDIVSNPRGSQFEDRAGSIRITTGSGKRFFMEVGSDQGHGLQVTYAGRNGMIGINELTGEMVTSVREAEFRDLPTTRYGMPAQVGHESIAPVEVIDSTAQVLKALLNGQNMVTAEQGTLAVKVLVAAYISAERGGEAVRLDANLDRIRVFPWA